MLDGVTIEQLRTLRAVVEGGSFSAAARKLGRVQAAVSQSIDRLEAQLGLRLFDRSGRVPRLTRDGEAIAAAAAKVDGEVGALDELVSSLKRGEETTLSIVVDALFPTSSLVGFAKDFASAHPSVDLVLFTDTLSAVTAHVREKRSTWGIANEDADFTGLERRPVADVLLVPVAAPTHPLAGERGTIPQARLTDAVQIVLGEHRPDRAEETRGVFSRSSRAASAGGTCPSTWCATTCATESSRSCGSRSGATLRLDGRSSSPGDAARSSGRSLCGPRSASRSSVATRCRRTPITRGDGSLHLPCRSPGPVRN